jgi:hypothetical protein
LLTRILRQTIAAAIAFSSVHVMSVAALSQEQLAPADPSWDTRYVLTIDEDARRVPLPVYKSYLTSCQNGEKSLFPHDYPDYKARVYICEL